MVSRTAKQHKEVSTTGENSKQPRSTGAEELKHSILSCERVYDAKTDTARLKQSNLFKIYLVVAGSGILRALDQEIPCTRGDICILPPNVPHGHFLTSADGELTVRQIEFDLADWFGGSVVDQESPDYCYGIFRNTHVIAYATLNADMQDRLYRLYDYIERELLERQQGWRELIRGYLTDLLISTARYIDSAIKTTFSISAKEWNIACAVMEIVKAEHGDSALTLGAIAARLYISQSQLSRAFKKTTGEAFSDYLRSVRIARVCELLRDERLQIAQAAKECGFRDMNTFYKVFEGIVGTTPTKFRQAQSPTKEGLEKNTKKEKENRIMVIMKDISEQLQKGKSKIVKELVQQALDEGSNPEEILNEGLLAGMSIIGEKFKNNEVYVPEVLVAARAMNMGIQVLKPHLLANGVVATGKVCIGTVQGDLHDIGKNLVKMMMEGKGLEVIDLGTDVAPEAFVQAAIDNGCQVICCSALLTTTMGVMTDVVKAAEAAGIRDKVKIMVGGAPVNEAFCQQIGADCYTVDAASAADAAVKLCQG